MAVPRVAPTRGATTGTHHQPLPALQEKDKREVIRADSLRLPLKDGAITSASPIAVPGVINPRKKVSWRQNIVLREEQPPGELGPASCLRELPEYTHFVDEVTNPPPTANMSPRTQPLNLIVSVKRVERGRGSQGERENWGLVESPKKPRGESWGPRDRALSRGQ